MYRQGGLESLKQETTQGSVKLIVSNRQNDTFQLHCNTIRSLAVPQIFSVLLLDIGGVLFLVKLTIAQKIKFSIKDFFRKCDQIRSFRRIRSHLLKKSLM